MKIFRKAVADCVNGQISYSSSVIPVYDAKVFTGERPDIYIVLSTQTEQDITEAECTWQTKSLINIIFINKSGSEVSKDVIDDISNEFLELVLNLPGSDNLLTQSGFAIDYVKRESAVSGEVLISPTQSELQKIVTISAMITQLN